MFDNEEIDEIKNNAIIRFFPILIIFFVVFIVFNVLYFGKPFFADFTRKNDIIKFLNTGKGSNIEESCKKQYKDLEILVDSEEEWDISPVIYDYLYKLEKGFQYVQYYGNRYGKDLLTVKDVQNSKTENENFKYVFLGQDVSWLASAITNEDINQPVQTFLNKVVEDLETKFIHEGTSMTKGWKISSSYANSNEKFIKLAEDQWSIELPYQCQCVFQATGTKRLPYKYIYVDLPVLTYNKRNMINLVYENTETKEQGTVQTTLEFNPKNTGRIKKNMIIGLYGTVFTYQSASFGIYNETQEY